MVPNKWIQSQFMKSARHSTSANFRSHPGRRKEVEEGEMERIEDKGVDTKTGGDGGRSAVGRVSVTVPKQTCVCTCMCTHLFLCACEDYVCVCV